VELRGPDSDLEAKVVALKAENSRASERIEKLERALDDRANG